MAYRFPNVTWPFVSKRTATDYILAADRICTCYIRGTIVFPHTIAYPTVHEALQMVGKSRDLGMEIRNSDGMNHVHMIIEE